MQILDYLTQHSDSSNAIAAVASAVAAVLALGVSIAAALISYFSLKQQRKHDVLSARPIAAVTVGDYEESVRVQLCNHGGGPMLITKIEVRRGDVSKPAVIEWMPDLRGAVQWVDFLGPIAERSVLPGQELVLVRLDGDPAKQEFRRARDETRKALAPLTVHVEYSDIYDNKLPPYAKSLEWFER
jgi:hypothetical protein